MFGFTLPSDSQARTRQAQLNLLRGALALVRALLAAPPPASSSRPIGGVIATLG